MAPYLYILVCRAPTQLKNLLFYAAQCGVVESVAALRRNLKTTQLLKPWTPDLLVQEMARYQTINPGTPFQGIHLYPFGGLKQSARWLRGRSAVNNELNVALISPEIVPPDSLPPPGLSRY